MKIQKLIQSNNFGFLLSVGAVLVQSFHSQYVLKLVSSLNDVSGYDLTSYHSFIIAALISMAILYFTLRGKTKVAKFWAYFECYMNFCYYSIFILTQETPPYYLFFIAIPSSIALPIILALFSEELTQDANKEEDPLAKLRGKPFELVNITTNKSTKVKIK